MTLRVLVVAEDLLGMTLARDLCDRVVIERGPVDFASIWGDAALRETQRVWRGFTDADPWSTWSDVKTHGRTVNALGMKGGAVIAYRAVHVAVRLRPRPDVLVLCLDTQGNKHGDLREQMLDGLARAKVDDLPVVLAVAHQESEAWVVAGFEPQHRAERDVVSELRDELGFDPTEEAHRLTPDRRTDPRDAKRVCWRLLPGTEREHSLRGQQCWLATSLDTLERRGAHTGLSEYLAAIQETVLPRIAGAIR